MFNDIFKWNHISPKLTSLEVEQLKSYYCSYHRKCWSYKKALRRFKLYKYLGNSLSVMTGTGGIVSAIASGGIALVAVSSGALIIKFFMEHQNLELKIHNCTYAHQSYQHLLLLIKNTMRSGDFDEYSLIQQMLNIDNFVTDNSPDIDKFFKKYDKKFVEKKK